MQFAGSSARKRRTADSGCQVPDGLSGFARYTTVAPPEPTGGAGGAAGRFAVPRLCRQRGQIHVVVAAVRRGVERHPEGGRMVGERGIRTEGHDRAPAGGGEGAHHQGEQIVDTGAHQHLVDAHPMIGSEIRPQVMVLGIAVPGQPFEGRRGRRPGARRHAEGALVGADAGTEPVSRGALQRLGTDERIGRIEAGDQAGKRRRSACRTPRFHGGGHPTMPRSRYHNRAARGPCRDQPPASRSGRRQHLLP